MKALHRSAAVCIVVVAGVLGQALGEWAWTPLDCPTGSMTTPKAVSGNRIVGSYRDTAGQHGFLYDSGSWTTLDPPGTLASEGSDAVAISGNTIWGTYCYPEGSGGSGFTAILSNTYLYDSNTYTPFHLPGLDTSPSGTHAVPASIDGATMVGSIVSNQAPFLPGVNFLYNFYYDGTTWVTLNAPGTTTTSLYGISGNKIIGKCSTNSGPAYGVLYEAGTWRTLRSATGERAFPYGIEGSNIVGDYTSVTNEIVKKHGFYFDGTTWLTLDYPGAQATFARAISGNNIVGYYTDAGGAQHGFLLTVPEPATLSLLALGGLLIARRRRP